MFITLAPGGGGTESKDMYEAEAIYEEIPADYATASLQNPKVRKQLTQYSGTSYSGCPLIDTTQSLY